MCHLWTSLLGNLESSWPLCDPVTPSHSLKIWTYSQGQMILPTEMSDDVKNDKTTPQGVIKSWNKETITLTIQFYIKILKRERKYFILFIRKNALEHFFDHWRILIFLHPLLDCEMCLWLKTSFEWHIIPQSAWFYRVKSIV